jgi:hypothetical protein
LIALPHLRGGADQADRLIQIGAVVTQVTVALEAQRLAHGDVGEHWRAVGPVGGRMVDALHQAPFHLPGRGQLIGGARIAGGDHGASVDDAAVFQAHAGGGTAGDDDFGNLGVQLDRAAGRSQAGGERIGERLQAADRLAHTQPVQQAQDHVGGGIAVVVDRARAGGDAGQQADRGRMLEPFARDLVRRALGDGDQFVLQLYAADGAADHLGEIAHAGLAGLGHHQREADIDQRIHGAHEFQVRRAIVAI